MRLRDVVEDDLPAIYDHQRDPEAAAMAHFPARERDAFMDHWRTRIFGNATTIAKAIDVGGEVAGYVASWQPPAGNREIAYWLGRTFWGRGLATAAVAEFIAELETRRPLIGVVAVHNVASRRVLVKCGFVPRGAPNAGHDGVLEQALVLG